MNRLLSTTVTWLTILAACLSGLALMALAQRPAAADRLRPDHRSPAPQVSSAMSYTCSAASGADDPAMAGLEAPAALALAR